MNFIRHNYKSFVQIFVAFLCAHAVFNVGNYFFPNENICDHSISSDSSLTNVNPPKSLEAEDGPPLGVDAETEVKLGLKLDAENDAAVSVDEVSDVEAVIAVEDIENKTMYKIDYSLAHPFENSCWFPVIRRDDADLKSYITRYRNVDCRGQKQIYGPLVHQHRNGEIVVGKPHRSLVKKFNCEYKELSGTLSPYMNTPTLVGEWKKLPTGKRILIQKDQFVIQCKNNDEIVYHNAFAWISDKPRLTPPPAMGPTKYGISILTIDSTSRNQFYRHMPFTLKFMRDHEFQILYGYTKVGDNSAINWLPILAGMVYDYESRGFKNIISKDINFDYKKLGSLLAINKTIFDRAKDYGWPTLWNDEIANPGYGLFHYYGWRGFRRPPADYYFRSYYTYIYKNLGASSGCSNDSCQLSMNFYAGLTHGSASNLELYDIPVSDALQRMKTAGVLENTVLVIMGDHGQRISPIQKSHIGRIEERMSMMGIYMPKKFRDEYPEKYANLVRNRHRLTSNFDFHETLQDLLDLGSGHRRQQTEKHGTSLFETIPIDRNCKDAMIPENFCVCMETPDKTEKEIVQNAQTRIMAYIEDHIENSTKNTCIKKHDVKIDPESFKSATISKLARSGVRFVGDTKKVNGTIRAIFEVQLTGNIEVTTDQSKTYKGTFVARVQYNSKLDFIYVNADPLVRFKGCEEAKVVVDVCQCHKNA
uniref:Sulfatase domain-containing protein n=1 Tax=Panagrellus redivivus TaxID=6233 RepID=A0A7E4VN39_PANRE